jgi:predicted ATPase/DNA-binding winged helix-turn-helix (wHTH) protein
MVAGANLPASVGFGRFRVLPHRRELLIDGQPAKLGGRAFDILIALIEARGAVASKNALMARVWPGRVVEEHNLESHISALRAVLGPDRGLIRTVSGRGYQFTAEIRALSQADDQRGSLSPEAAEPEALPPTNVPEPVSEPIGRDDELAEVVNLMGAHRLVTLTGAGGIGKTRLAVALARELRPHFADGVWLAQFSPLADPKLVPAAVAAAVGLELGGEASVQSVARGLAGRRLLLVLDTCEHVIELAASMAEAALGAGSELRILATSRELLKAEGEWVYPVSPLAVPTADVEQGDFLEYGAIRLFLERARAANPRFAPDPPLVELIAAVCRRLDGIPLAIELAAARAPALGVEGLAVRLDDRFHLLTGGKRTALPRHQTLRATLDWSYELLTEPERVILRRLAVFAGPFSLEAATAVAADPATELASVVENLASLVMKSLVTTEGDGAVARYRLLDTTRAYALEKLIGAGEADTAARYHATYFRDFSAPIATNFGSGVPSVDVAAYAREIDNVRAALDWSFSTAGDVAIGVALTAAYVPVWLHSALMIECRERCKRALFHLGEQPTVNSRLRLQLQIGFGHAAFSAMRPVDEIRTVFASALDIAESLNDLDAQLSAIYALWGLHYYSGEIRAAFSVVERLSALASSVGEPYLRIITDRLIGNTLHHQGVQHRAQAYLERVSERSATLATRRRSFFPLSDQRVLVHVFLSRVLLLRGCLDRAAEQARTGLEEAIATGNELIVCQALGVAVCDTALMIGDLVAAQQHIARLVDIANALNAPRWMSAGRCLEGKLLIAQGALEAGSNLLRSELDVCERTGWTSWYPELLGVYAEGLAGLGRFPEALASIDQALAKADQGGERYYVAELLRLKGEFLLAQSNGVHTAAIDDCFHSALRLAQDQGALLFELRTARSLARLRVTQGRGDAARQILAPVYDRFTEGFETADLKAAKALLDTLL